jgi:ABC-2 type transport system ATP-binding protein
VILRCSDSDSAIRALLERHPHARDIEIAGAGLEEAFLELTSDGDEDGVGDEDAGVRASERVSSPR